MAYMREICAMKENKAEDWELGGKEGGNEGGSFSQCFQGTPH